MFVTIEFKQFLQLVAFGCVLLQLGFMGAEVILVYGIFYSEVVGLKEISYAVHLFLAFIGVLEFLVSYAFLQGFDFRLDAFDLLADC